MTPAPSTSQPRQRIDAWSATHVGLVREGNEDAYRSTPARGIFIVADGIGGHPGGEFASSIAVESCHESLTRNPDMSRAFSYANQCVLAAADRNPRLHRMGSTLVAVQVTRGEALFAHCGDSRAYLMRQGALILLTQDHGEGGVLSACIGDEKRTTCEVRGIVTQSSDRILLCTDGLTSYVSEILIANVLRANREPKAAVTALINETLRVGAPDNITAIVVRIKDR